MSKELHLTTVRQIMPWHSQWRSWFGLHSVDITQVKELHVNAEGLAEATMYETDPTTKRMRILAGPDNEALTYVHQFVVMHNYPQYAHLGKEET